jgi:hypothetical protein
MHKEQVIERSEKATLGRLKVTKATYLDGYRLLIEFTDNKHQIVDFSEVLSTRALGYYGKYREPKNFKKFRIENGNVVWGKNWDLIFPIEQLYKGKIEA